MKNTKSLVYILALTFGLLELGSFGYLTASGKYPKTSYLSEYSEITSKSSNVDTFKNQNVRPHPFFGFVHTFDFSNYFGFDTGEIPTEKDPKRFVIGVFGGSVAEGWGSDLARDQKFKDALRARVPALKNKEITIINFALGAWKQPQQFIAYSYFLDSIDLSINLDGFNEVAFNFRSRFPVEYPVFSDLLFFPNRAAESDLERLRGIVKTRRALSDLFSLPILRSSSLAYLTWKSYMQSSERRKNEIFAKAMGDAGNPDLDTNGSNYYKAPMSDADAALLGAKNWAKYTALQNQIASANHKPAFFFLQPNQYDPGSKPLSKEEIQLTSPSRSLGREKYVPQGYRALRTELLRLKQSGARIYDLSGVFKGHGEQLYVDDCCHFSAKGNPLITERVLDALVSELKKR